MAAQDNESFNVTIKEMYVKINNKHKYNILNLSLQQGVNTLPYCTIAISAGVLLESDAKTDDIQVDDECAIYIKLLNSEHLVFAGFIASKSFELQSTAQEVQGYYSYRVAISAESIDAIAPASVRYLTGATGFEKALVPGYIITKDGVSTGTSQAYNTLMKNRANSDVCWALLTSVDQLYDCIQKNETKYKEPPEKIRKHFVYDKIKLNSPTDVSMDKRLTDMVASHLIGGSAYLDIILEISRSIYLTYLPVNTGNTYKLKLTHLNNWSEPVSSIDLYKYCSMSSADMSRKADSIDGIVIPKWSDAGDKPTTALWAFYGQLKGDNKAKIHHITPDNMDKLTTQNRLRCKQMFFPEWLSDGTALHINQCCARLCKEFFAEYACGGRTLGVTVPFTYYFNFAKCLGQPVKISLLDGHSADMDRSKAKDKVKHLIGVVAGILLQVQTVQSALSVTVSVNFTHIRTPEEQKIYGFKDDDLLYVKSK